MAKAHFVKSARKDNPAVKKGESYYWWQFYKQRTKHYSATRPKRSQLTQSAFLSAMYTIEDELAECSFSTHDDAVNFIEDISQRIDELRDEAQDALDSLPEQLQDSHMLNERIEAIEQMYDEVEGVATGDAEEAQDKLSEDEENEDLQIELSDALDAIADELQCISYGGY